MLRCHCFWTSLQPILKRSPDGFGLGICKLRVESIFQYLCIPRMATVQGVFSECLPTKWKPRLLGYHPDYFFLQSRLEVPPPSDSRCPHCLETLSSAPTLLATGGAGECPADSLWHFGHCLENGRPLSGPVLPPNQFSSLTQACLLSTQQPVPMCFPPESFGLQHTGLNGTRSTGNKKR